MGRKSEARAARQLERIADFERVKSSVVERLAGRVESPRVAQLPDEERLTPRIGVPVDQLAVPEQPRTAKERSRLGAIVTWCVRKRDIDGMWSWQEPRAWSDDEWHQVIAPAFGEFEKLSWGEVQRQVSGEGHLMHHDQLVGTLVEEAQLRWLELGLEEFDSAFRFRLGNTRRFWGFIVQGHFFGVWWDRNHNIYPT
mgnify:CR=1 FL=1